MIKPFLIALLTVFLVACAPVDTGANETESDLKGAQEVPEQDQEIFIDKCELGKSLVCIDYRVSKEQIQLTMANVIDWEIGPLYVSSEHCSEVLHSRMVPGRSVRFTLSDCGFDIGPIEEKIFITYTYQANNQTVNETGILKTRVRR